MADEKLKKLILDANSIELEDFVGKTVVLKQECYDKRIKDKELSKSFVDWYNENKDKTFVAKKASDTKVKGVYSFEGVDVWIFNEHMIKEITDEKETIDKWYIRLFSYIKSKLKRK